MQKGLEIRFGEGVPYVGKKYNGLTSHVGHLTICTTTCGNTPKKEWVHMFIHTLETIPRNWYRSLDI